MKRTEKLHRLYQTIKFNRPISKETDCILPGGDAGYKLKMKDEDGREEVIQFDFDNFKINIDRNDPCIIHCMQKNPDHESFKDIDKITAHMLRNITDVVGWFTYTRNPGEGEIPLEPVAVTDVKFEVIDQDGIITSICMPLEWDPISIIKSYEMDRERCMDLLHSIVNHITSIRNTAESLDELLLMGFTPNELVREFDFGEDDINDAVRKMR